MSAAGCGLPPEELAALLAKLAPPAPIPPPGLTCTVCAQPLDTTHADLMTHPACDPTPPPTPPPPSTLGELQNILIDYEASRPRSTQVAVGPSQIAVPCDRRLGYSLHSVGERPDGRVKWAPLVGTAVHALIADAMEAENKRLGRERWLVERRVHPDPMISGSCDVYDVDTDTVIDWKVVGPTSLARYIRGGPGPQYEGQIHLYGRGWQRAGRNPRWVRIVFLPRTTTFEDAHEWTAPYSRQLADAALDRVYAISDLLTTLNVTDQPHRWAEVPASPDRLCAWCPYMRRGGPADGTGCPGDVETEALTVAKFGAGIIP